MATGQKISAMTAATTWSGSDQAVIVQSGANKSITHDVLMDDAQICKAWVNYNTVTTTTITDDFNVSSLTDNGVGDTTINFVNNMNDTNYIGAGSTNRSVDGTINFSSYALGSVRCVTGNGAGALQDLSIVTGLFFGS